MKRIGVSALIKDPEVIKLLNESKAKDKSFELHTVRSGVIMSLIPDKTGQYSSQPYVGSFRMELTEGKSEDRVVTVICDRNGKKIKPYWVKNRKSQRSVDAEIDIRFSVESACIVTLDKNGVFTVSMARIENDLGAVGLYETEIFSTVLKKIGGIFLFNENMFAESDRRQFKDAAKAAIFKANCRDSGGAKFFVEKTVSYETQPQGTMDSSRGYNLVCPGGMSMVDGRT